MQHVPLASMVPYPTHQLQRDAGPMDCRLDNTDVHVGEEKSLNSARNQTGDISIARMCCLGPLLQPILRSYSISMPHAVIW